MRMVDGSLREEQHTLESLFNDEHNSLHSIVLECMGKQLPHGFFKSVSRNNATLHSLVLNNLPKDCRVCMYDLFRRLEVSEFTKLEEFVAARTYVDECYINIEETLRLPPSIKIVTLYGLGIVSVPGSFAKLDQLTSLSLVNNILTSLSPLTSDNSLKQLQVLDISENSLVTVPEAIDVLANLQVLNISQNCLKKTIPISMSRLTHLRTLCLEWNRLEEIPCKHLLNLTNLTSLNLAHNKVKSLSTLLIFHPSLQRLDLSGNEGLLLQAEHQNQNMKPPALLELDMSSTQLNSLPLWLPELQSLQIIKANHNQLTDINMISEMPKLNMASFTHNLVHDCVWLFNSLNHMTALSILDLTYNKLPGIEEETIYINDIKVLLPGNGHTEMHDSHDDYSSSVATSQIYHLPKLCCCRRE